ncbi:MAG TPA: protein kinase [Polyangiaceae bacterium]|nr:protein kinase [Polyangiaceae bacterium]
MERASPPKAGELRPAAPSALIAQRIAGRYRVQSELGRGGMGAVFRVLDEGCERVVALKLLESSSSKLTALFEREYETLAKLAHPRVIQVYDFGLSESGGRYYTMELLNGADLLASAPLPWVRSCEHLRDVCTSLSLLHAQRLVHRDVNPRNVRLDDSGRAKLLDFGALAPFGLATELVGTPSCMAPEVLRGQPLDARTDLFSLGAVAYWCLTGRLPHAIRRLSDAEQGWHTPPVPPSQWVPGIPQALDELIVSLLSIDPLGRPASAAEVLDRLSAIALLDDTLLAGIAESHLSSAALAGRESEQAKVEQLVARALRSRGGTLLFEGGPGIGRSRMLADLQVRGRLAGLSVVATEGRACTAPGQLVSELLRRLREVAPQEVRASLPRHAALHEVASAAQEATGANIPALHEHAREPHERAMRGASALVGLIREVCAQRPLLITVDDAHLLPALDAGVLPLLAYAAQDGRLMLCVTRLSDAAAPAAIEQLRALTAPLTLAPLEPLALEQLVRSIFGEVPHRARLAQWLLDASRGNPGQVQLVLRDLVGRGVVRYAQGAWVLPAEIGEDLLPAAATELDNMRLARLGPAARALSRLFALQRGSLSEALCVRLLPEHAPHEVLMALSELCADKLVDVAGEGYRLAREGLRTPILSGLFEGELKSLHLDLAHTLRAGSADQLAAMAAARVQQLTTSELLAGVSAGRHFLCAGEYELGTRLLRAGAVELTIRGDGLTAALPDLELAIEAYRKLGVRRRVFMALLIPLTLAGTYADFRLSYRYGDEALTFLSQSSGLGMARSLARFLGGRFGLVCGLLLGFARYQLWLKRSMGTSYKEILLGLMGIGSAVLGVCTVLQDRERARWVADLLSPLRFFSALHPARMVHEFQLAMLDHAEGHYDAAWRRSHAALAYVQSQAAAAKLPEDARRQLEAGIYILLGQLDALRTDGSGRQTLAAIDQLRTSTSRQTQAATRVAFHGHRGEREAYVRALDEMDRLAAQAGSTWRNDVQVPRMLWSSYALCEDVMSLKRAVQQLDRLAGEATSIARLRDATSASYLAERGMASEALARHEQVFEALRDDPSVRSVQYLGCYARILRKAGQHARARAVCEQVLARLDAEQLAFTLITFGVRLELGLALSHLGEHEQALAVLRALAAEQAPHDNLLLQGLIHGALVEVALLRNDCAEVQHELRAMESCFRSTEHPALFAQFQRLSDRVRARAAGELRASLAPPAEAHGRGVERALRTHALLTSAIAAARAESGYLFTLGEGGLALSATTNAEAPLATGLVELAECVRQDGGQSFETELGPSPLAGAELALSTVLDDAFGTPLATPWRDQCAYWFLLAREGQVQAPLGVLVLLEGKTPLSRISRLLLAQLTRELGGE